MAPLVIALARAELRRTRLVSIVCAYGVAGALVAVATRPDDFYPVLSGAVENLVYLAPILLAAAAWPLARMTESGMARELYLCGISPSRQRLAAAVIAVGVACLIWLCGSAIAAALVALALWLSAEPVVLVGPIGPSVAWWAAAGVSSSIVLGLVGCACGSACRTRAAAIAVVVALGAAAQLLALFGAFPPALWLRSLTPGGALDAVFVMRDDVRGEASLRWGVPTIYLLGSAWLITSRRRASSAAGVSPRSPESREGWLGTARASRLAAAAPVVLLLAAAVILGAIAPQRLAREIPWWLHGSWVQDLARNRASAPVAESFVAAVISGDRWRERGLSLGRRDDVLDPVVRDHIRRARNVYDVEYEYDSEARPGTVLMRLGSPRSSLDLRVCNARTADGWRVTRVLANNLC